MSGAGWLKGLIQWLRQLLGLQTAAPSKIEILEEYHAEDGSISVFRIRDRSIPGAVDLWKIERHREGVGWFAIAIDLAQLREDLAGTGLSAARYLQRHHGFLAGQLDRQLAEQSRFFATHYWICGFSQEITGVDSRGRFYRSRRISGLKVLAGDYQGAAGVFNGSRHIQRISRKIVDQIANDKFREFHLHQTWKAAVGAIDWVRWHEGILQSSGGITPDHRLQVSKPLPRVKGKDGKSIGQ